MCVCVYTSTAYPQVVIYFASIIHMQSKFSTLLLSVIVTLNIMVIDLMCAISQSQWKAHTRNPATKILNFTPGYFTSVPCSGRSRLLSIITREDVTYLPGHIIPSRSTLMHANPKVGPTYLQSANRVDYSDETRLAADTNIPKGLIRNSSTSKGRLYLLSHRPVIDSKWIPAVSPSTVSNCVLCPPPAEPKRINFLIP